MTSALLCLSLVVFRESRGEPIEGQQAVVEVVLNRAKNSNKPLCDVVFQKGQFSGIQKQGIPNGSNKYWQATQSLSSKYLSENYSTNHTNGATYFRVASLGYPKNSVNKTKIGHHIFYNLKDN